MINIFDPHLHFFALDSGDYHWLKPDSAPFWPDKEKINHSVYEDDLILPENIILTGFVHIEAGFNNTQPEQEFAWLQQHCRRTFKSIGFVDICSPNFAEQLQRLSQYDAYIGIRHILDDDAVEILSAPQTLHNLQLLAEQNLIFEAQYSIANLSATTLFINLVKQCENLKVVINHAGSPAKNTCHQQWTSALTELATLDNCFIKCSGWEMQDRAWQVASVIENIKQCISAFGLDRVMLASNFPVSNLAYSYSDIWQNYVLGLSDDDFFTADKIKQLVAVNAKLFYRF
ncbi:amidohydrolase [Colwelliaceae bacterium BS250]